jgi:DNA-binding transcriptional regulator YiaG
MNQALSHTDFKEVQRKLGLSVSQMALMLGVTDIQVRRMGTAPELGSHRPVNGATQRLLQAYLEGYRPKDWPTGISATTKP